MRRDQQGELAAKLGEWIDDLQSLAERGEFLFSANDYAVLLRKPPTEYCSADQPQASGRLAAHGGST